MARPLPEHLYPAYEWIESAAEWDEALADPTYAHGAFQNAVLHGYTDVTEHDLAEAIEWRRRELQSEDEDDTAGESSCPHEHGLPCSHCGGES